MKPCSEPYPSSHFLKDLSLEQITQEECSGLTKAITMEEVKANMFSISKDKSPCLDGLNGFFFHKTWNILGVDISNAIIDFFNNN